MPRLKLRLAYEGTRYAGWQLQARRDGNGPSTIQGVLEACVSRVTTERIPIHAAGRTDAGVHAEGQVCHVDLPEKFLRVDWQKALNVQLPQDIRILEAAWVLDSFHARKSALSKKYAYTLWTGRDKALPRIAPFVWSAPALDLERIVPVLATLTGKHDFASFRNNGDAVQNTVRTLHSISLKPGWIAGLVCPPEWPVYTLLFEGDGFLKQMVRNLVGLLAWVAQGKIAAKDVPGILAARHRAALPSPSAPACGLTLLEVVY